VGNTDITWLGGFRLFYLLTLFSRADWSCKSERYCQTVHCFQNIWFNKRTHSNEQRNGHRL